VPTRGIGAVLGEDTAAKSACTSGAWTGTLSIVLEGEIGCRSDDGEVVLGPGVRILHELPEFAEPAEKYGLTYRTPDWLDDVVRRYGLKPPTH